VRLRFATDSRSLEIRFAPHAEPFRLDLTSDGELLESVTVPKGSASARFAPLPAGEKALEVWLPQTAPICLEALSADADAGIRVLPDRRPRWTTYGSSITHCGSAHSPARTWPAVVARSRGANLTCLGFGGQCHLDPLMGRVIRDTPADFISLKLGINVQGGATLNGRTFMPAVIGLVTCIREKQPRVPIAVVSPIISPPRETTDNIVGMSLCRMREQLEDAVARLQRAGDACIRYVDGRELFGEELVEDYLPDLLHPNGDGYEILGKRFAEKVWDPIMGARGL
jgi:hypothetical protein